MAAAGKVVVIAVDNSQVSAKVVEHAASLLPEGSDVRLVHVQPALEPTSPGSEKPEQAVELEEETGFKHFLTSALLPKIQTRFPNAQSVLLSIGGSTEIGACLVSYAAGQSASLIVLASHGKQPSLNGSPLGPVADYLVRNSQQPLLLLNDNAIGS